jgi:hypothetical protein
VRKAEARFFIECVVQGRIGLGFTRHFRDELMGCAPGVDRFDVHHALQHARLRGEPVRDDEFVCHKVRVGVHFDGLGAYEIVLAISPLDEVTCLTIYRV